MTQETSDKKTGTKCPDHGYKCLSSRIYDHETGEEVCGISGVVLSEVGIDKGPEWRAFDDEQKAKRSRVGAEAKYSIHDKGLSTAISQVDRDAFGRKLPLSTRYQMWRLRKWQIRSRVHTSVDKNLVEAMNELDRLKNQLLVPEYIKEKAAVIYRKVLDKGLIRGRSIAAIAAAALYAACRSDEKVKRTLREISDASLVEKKDVGRCYRFIRREIPEVDKMMLIEDPIQYASKIAEITGISGKTQDDAIKLLRKYREKKYVVLDGEIHPYGGKNYPGLAAAALYVACLHRNEKKTQRELAEASDITEVTIRNRYKAIKYIAEKEFGWTIID